MSPRYSLNAVDAQKIGKGFLIAIGGAGVTYLLNLLPNIDFGQWNFLILPLASTGLNAALKFFENQS